MNKQLNIRCEANGWFTAWVENQNTLTTNQRDHLLNHIGWYRLLGYEVTYD